MLIPLCQLRPSRRMSHAIATTASCGLWTTRPRHRRGEPWRELFYLNTTGTVMGVRVQPGSAWSAGTPVEIVRGRYYRGGGAGGGSDGAAPTPSFVVVFNWTEELKRLASAR